MADKKNLMYDPMEKYYYKKYNNLYSKEKERVDFYVNEVGLDFKEVMSNKFYLIDNNKDEIPMYKIDLPWYVWVLLIMFLLLR